MASRIMHYAIATIIADDLGITDKKKFILGNLEPDISSKQDGSYNLAHFSERNELKQTKGINYRKFVMKYKDAILYDEEVLGYFCHLVADAYWLNSIQDKHIRKYCGEKKKERISQGYKEMQAYNPILIRRFCLKNEIQSITELKMEETDVRCKETFLDGLRADFMTDEIPKYEFVVYPYKEVLDFIHNAVSIIKEEILALREEKEMRAPEEWFVKDIF